MNLQYRMIKTYKTKKAKYFFKDLIPSRYRYSHKYCVYLLNHIIHVHNSCKAGKIYNTKVNLNTIKKNDIEEFKNLNSEEILKWLYRKKYSRIHFEMVYKFLIQGLIGDLILFLSEALYNSSKGNLIITFTLLRKPLKENLILLEWLLVNPGDFYKAFCSDISKVNPLAINSDKRKKLVREAVSKVDNLMLDFELIYNIRYNKNDYFTYDVIWNHSTHLVTTFKGVETENMNLNYIFSDEKALDTQWEGLYFLLPYLLYYISELQNKLFELGQIMKEDHNFCKEENKKYLGLIAWSIENEFWDKDSVNLDVLSNKDMIKDISCNKCNNSFTWGIKIIKHWVIYDYIKCKKCGNRIVVN